MGYKNGYFKAILFLIKAIPLRKWMAFSENWRMCNEIALEYIAIRIAHNWGNNYFKY
jgi:hypothetical protein